MAPATSTVVDNRRQSLVGVAKPSREVLEARQESQILTTYALSPYLRAYDFKVTVCHGNATLSGSVAEDVSKELAGQIALGVAGINRWRTRSKWRRTTARRRDHGTQLRATGRRCDDHLGGEVETGVESSCGRSRREGRNHARHGESRAPRIARKRRTPRASSRATPGVNSVDNQIVVDAAENQLPEGSGHRHH